MRTPDTELTYVALGVAALFAIATVLVVVWGVMKQQAIDEERAAQADLRHQLDVLESSPSMWPQPVDLPLVTTPTLPSDITLAEADTPVPVSEAPLDSFWTLSGDPATDEELLHIGAIQWAGDSSVYEESTLPASKRKAMDKMMQQLYAKHEYIERQLGGDTVAIQRRFREIHQLLIAEQKRTLTPREFTHWQRLGYKGLYHELEKNYTFYVDHIAQSMSSSTKEHVAKVIAEEQVDATIRAWEYMPNEDNHYVRNIAIQSEAIRCAREKLTPLLSRNDLAEVNLVLDNMVFSLGLLGDQVAQSMDQEQQSSP